MNMCVVIVTGLAPLPENNLDPALGAEQQTGPLDTSEAFPLDQYGPL